MKRREESHFSICRTGARAHLLADGHPHRSPQRRDDAAELVLHGRPFLASAGTWRRACASQRGTDIILSYRIGLPGSISPGAKTHDDWARNPAGSPPRCSPGAPSEPGSPAWRRRRSGSLVWPTLSDARNSSTDGNTRAKQAALPQQVSERSRRIGLAWRQSPDSLRGVFR